jgi:hypothetical protein
VQKFVRCGSFLNYSINVNSNISGDSKPPGQKLDINGHKSRKLPHMVKCHVRTFRQGLSVTRDKGYLRDVHLTGLNASGSLLVVFFDEKYKPDGKVTA